MSSLIGVIALAAAAAFLELPKLIQNKRTRELIVFSVLLVTATALYGALVMEVNLPNPFMIIKIIYGPLK
ncbi:hypothetical protein [Paenibacillus harenae]|uniref:Cyanate permease n=1 Tax=Paenibacillus harenae TaxID=306543 RepID=A0ABT9U7R4_PAEHA|nr:hypothetical protein [Paenibacillus harenae]MDQ0115684.1 cyanate permease [Paenibacillus harenae]